MTPLTPANLAAIERRAAAATEALARPAGALYVEQSLSAADVPALLRHIAALQAQHAGEVAAAEDALTTAREERDAARSALDELVAAVRVEREAVAHLTRARHRSARAWDDGADAENEARQAHYEADDAMREATERLDALLSAAPPPATVPAALVRRQIGAVLAANGCDCDCGHSSDEHDDDCDRCLACRVEGALDAALAGCP